MWLPPSHIAALVASVLLLVGCGSADRNDTGRSARGDEAADNVPAVEAVKARYGALPLEERLGGRVRAHNQVVITPEVGAPVVDVMVEMGAYVKAGTPLVRLKADAYRERVRQAEASLRIAQADVKRARATLNRLQAKLNRTEQLAEKKFESREQLETLRAEVAGAEADLERAEAEVARAQATLDERQADLRRTVVRAPISGHVGTRTVEVGQRVGPETHLYTMGDLDSVIVQVHVTDAMIGRIRPGQTARIHVPPRDTTLQGAVTRMSPFLNDASYSAEADIVLDNTDRVLTPGMFVEVDVAYGESRQATLVPLSALYEDPSTGTRGVFVAPTLGTEIPVTVPDTYRSDDPPPLTKPTPTTFRPVEVVAEGRQTAGVRGIQPDEWVITVGQNLLSTTGENRVNARVRPMSWTRLLSLQRLQDTDLLRNVLERQQRLARQRFGADSTAAPDTASSPDSSVAAAPRTAP